jgi:hypothetical protein
MRVDPAVIAPDEQVASTGEPTTAAESLTTPAGIRTTSAAARP